MFPDVRKISEQLQLFWNFCYLSANLRVDIEISEKFLGGKIQWQTSFGQVFSAVSLLSFLFSYFHFHTTQQVLVANCNTTTANITNGG